jgi:hypothetical protein
MAGPTSVPCPMCGRLNALTRTTCSTCEYEFVSAEERDERGSMIGRVVSRLTGRPS